MFSLISKNKKIIETPIKNTPNNRIIIVYLFTFSCLLVFSSTFPSFLFLAEVVLILDCLDKLAEDKVGILIFRPFPSYFILKSSSSEVVPSLFELSLSLKLSIFVALTCFFKLWYPFFFFFISFILNISYFMPQFSNLSFRCILKISSLSSWAICCISFNLSFKVK